MSELVPPPVGAVRTLTWLDLLVCAALATPLTAPWLLAFLNSVSAALGSGAVQYPADGAAFFVNLAGLFGVLWNVAMLNAIPRYLHQVDLVARLGVIALIAFHVAMSGLSAVFALFVLTELIGGAAKMAWLKRK